MTSPFQGMQQNNMIPGMTNNAMGTNGGMLGANNVMPANGMMTVSVRNGNGGTTTVSVPIGKRTLPVSPVLSCQRRSKRVDNVQGPRRCRGPQPKLYHWFEGPSLFHVHGPPKVSLRL